MKNTYLRMIVKKRNIMNETEKHSFEEIGNLNHPVEPATKFQVCCVIGIAISFIVAMMSVFIFLHSGKPKENKENGPVIKLSTPWTLRPTHICGIKGYPWDGPPSKFSRIIMRLVCKVFCPPDNKNVKQPYDYGWVPYALISIAILFGVLIVRDFSSMIIYSLLCMFSYVILSHTYFSCIFYW